MGGIIEILEETSPFSFRILFTPTGKTRTVTVDPDKEECFSQTRQETGKAMACPFLIKENAASAFCMIHASRPNLCHQYACYRTLILGTEGKKAGRGS